MTLLSMYQRDESRNVYRILADQAVKYIDHPTGGPEARILFTNLARLLERYRYNFFSNHGVPGILEVFAREQQLAQQKHKEETASKSLEVIPALECAHARVYKTLSKDELVPKLQNLLASLAQSHTPEDAGPKEDLQNARLFFVTLADTLNERGA
jgi:hypothetical protein